MLPVDIRDAEVPLKSRFSSARLFISHSYFLLVVDVQGIEKSPVKKSFFTFGNLSRAQESLARHA